jgi:hypothetical protein
MLLTYSANLSYQAPGGSNVSQSISAQATYQSQQAGSIDIPSGTASGAAFPLQFGSVQTAVGLMIKGVDSSVAAFFNGATGGTGQPIGTGGAFVNVSPNPCQAAGFTSAVVVATKQQQVLGRVDYVVWGDP